MELQLLQDHLQQRAHMGTGALDHVMCGLGVQGVPHLKELPEPHQRVGHLQKGATLVMPQTPKHVLRRGSQVKNNASFSQSFAVQGANHRAASCGQHAVGALGQLIDHLRLDVSEALLALDFEELANGATQALLNGVIRIDEGQVQFSGEMTAHSGFSTAGQTDQYKHSVVSLKGEEGAQKCTSMPHFRVFELAPRAQSPTPPPKGAAHRLGPQAVHQGVKTPV